jgi:hypothetical protein
MTNQLPDATKMVLSPAAQAVMDAAVTKITLSKKLAAALRAAADQVVPIKEEPSEPPGYGIGYEPAEYVQDWTCWHVRRQLRHKLLAIAAELEGQQ